MTSKILLPIPCPKVGPDAEHTFTFVSCNVSRVEVEENRALPKYAMGASASSFSTATSSTPTRATGGAVHGIRRPLTRERHGEASPFPIMSCPGEAALSSVHLIFFKQPEYTARREDFPSSLIYT